MLLEPKEIEIETSDGSNRVYIISKFPAIAGREIICNYPVTAIPKIGEYKSNEDIMKKLMKYVAVRTGEAETILQTDALINNHVPDWETLMKIEAAMINYNCSFFQNGKISSFFGMLSQKAEQLISSTLTDSLGQLLQTAKQASNSSEKNTH